MNLARLLYKIHLIYPKKLYKIHLIKSSIGFKLNLIPQTSFFPLSLCFQTNKLVCLSTCLNMRNLKLSKMVVAATFVQERKGKKYELNILKLSHRW